MLSFIAFGQSSSRRSVRSLSDPSIPFSLSDWREPRLEIRAEFHIAAHNHSIFVRTKGILLRLLSVYLTLTRLRANDVWKVIGCAT
jgi:hypothetical protein